MEHAYVPTKSAVQKAGLDKLVAEVRSQHIFDEAHEVLDLLTEEFDQTQIAYKLVSLLMERTSVKGPNNIGIAPQRLEKILKSLERNDRGGRNNRGRGSSRHNRRRHSSGGGRGGHSSRNRQH
jgi:ATP-dependent RNA helicase DeaD